METAGRTGNEEGDRNPVLEELGLVSPRRPLLRLKVSPERRAHSAPVSKSPNTLTLNLTWDEEEATSFLAQPAKRKRLDQGNAGEKECGLEGRQSLGSRTGSQLLAADIRKTIAKLDKASRTLATLAKERNTKKERKEVALQFRSWMSPIQTAEARELLQKLGGEGTRIPSPEVTCDAEIQTQNGNIKDKKTAEIGTQTEAITDFTKRHGGGEEPNKVTEEDIRAVRSYEDFINIRNRHWPRSIFKSAFTTVGTPRKVGKETDLLAVIGSGNEES